MPGKRLTTWENNRGGFSKEYPELDDMRHAAPSHFFAKGAAGAPGGHIASGPLVQHITGENS